MPTTFLDIRTSVMNRIGWPTSDTTLVTRVNLVINQVNRDIALQRPWRDLQRRATIVTFTPVTTGNINVTQGSATVSGGSTSPTFVTNGVAANDKIKTSGRLEIYTVRSVDSETQLTLGDVNSTTAWQGSTATDQSYRIWRDEYALASDFARPVNYIDFLDQRRLRPIGLRELRERYPWPAVPGDPKFYTLVRPATGSQLVWNVLIYPPPDERMILPYEYITSNMAYTTAGVGQATLSADDDEPWMDERFRHVLVWGALAELYRDYKDDTRSAEALNLYHDGIRRMANDEEPTHDRPRLKLDQSGWRRMRWGRHYPRYDINNRFDRML